MKHPYIRKFIVTLLLAGMITQPVNAGFIGFMGTQMLAVITATVASSVTMTVATVALAPKKDDMAVIGFILAAQLPVWILSNYVVYKFAVKRDWLKEGDGTEFLPIS